MEVFITAVNKLIIIFLLVLIGCFDMRRRKRISLMIVLLISFLDF